MEEREGDPRICIASFLFLFCIVTGGIFLSLSITLPDGGPSWYPVVGMIFVCIPWVFWLMAYVYRCFKPCCTANQFASHQLPSRNNHPTKSITPPACSPRTPKDSAFNDVPASSPLSPMQSPKGDRHVHFAGIHVMQNNDNNNNNGNNNDTDADIEAHSSKDETENYHNPTTAEKVLERPNSSKESEIPLRLTVSP